MPHSRQMCGMFWIPHHYANGPYFDGRSSFDLYCINSTHHRGYLAVDEVENDEGHGGVSGEQLPHTGLLGGKTSDAFRPHHTDRSMDAGHKGNRKHRRHCEQQVNLTNQATRTPRTAVQLLCYCWGKHTHTHTHRPGNESGRHEREAAGISCDTHRSPKRGPPRQRGNELLLGTQSFPSFFFAGGER